MADSNILNPYERIWKTRDLRALETPIELENNLSSFERGLGRFGQQMQGTGYGLAALASQGVQNVIGENPVTQGIVDWGLEGYNEAMAKSQPGAYYAPKVARIEDIKSPSDALEWGAGMLGEQLPLAASLLLTGGVGGAVARLGANTAVKDIAKAAVGTAVKKSVEQGALKATEGQLVTAAMRDAASKALLDTTLKGAAVTGFMGTAGLEGGLSFGETVQGGAPPADAVKTAITVGGLNGALELLTPFVIAKRMGMGDYAKNSIKQIIKTNPDLSKRAVAIAKELGTRGAKGFAEGATIEGVTESLQELTAIAGERWAKNDPLFADLTEQDWSRIKNASAGGLFVGGVLGGAGATLSGPKTTDNAPTDTNAPPAGTIVPPAVKTREQEIEAALAKTTANLEAAKAAGDTKAIQELQQIKELYDAALGKQKPVLEPTLETLPNEQSQPIIQGQPAPSATETQSQPPLEMPAGPERTGGIREEGTGTETRPVGEVVQPTPGERIQLKRGEEIVLTPNGTPVRTSPTPEEVEALRQRMGPRPEKQTVQPIEETANGQEVQAQTEAQVKGIPPLYSKPIGEIKSPSEGIVGEATMEEFEAVRRQFQERQSQTPFKKWFGTGTPNVTATKEGEPITLYHGTNNPEFFEWDSTKAGEASGHPTSGLGFFMTANPGAAARYGNNLLELHAKINNPYTLTDADLTRIETTQDAVQLRKKLMSEGYDGAVVTAPGASPYVIAFQANQIKLKSNTAPTSSPDMRYSKPLQAVTPEMDAKYLAAVEQGDIEAAQRMVDEAAKEAGYTIDAWHGTTERGLKRIRPDKAIETKNAIFLAENENVADTFTIPREYGEPVYEDENGKEIPPGENIQAKLMLKNPLVLEGDTAQRFVDDTTFQVKTVEQAVADGHGGILAKNVLEGIGEQYKGDNYVVFEEGLVKRAEPVTYDDAGNIIPLSQRFNEATPDIRYTQQPNTVTIPLQDFQSNIDSIMGEGWLRQATEAGLVEVIEGKGPNGESGSWAGDRIRLYTGSMPKDGSPAGVLLHEGKHVTFEDVLGNSLPEYIKDLHTLANNGNKVAQDAITHAAIAVADVLGIKHNLLEGGTKTDLKNLRALIEQERPGLLAEEELAYFVQYGTDAQTGTGFWKRLINQIKAWFAQTKLGQRMKELGIGFEMTDAMAVEWAKMGLNRSLEKLQQAEKARVQAEKQASTMPASARLGKVLGMLEEVDPLYAMTIAANEQIDKEIEGIKKKYINTPQWMKAPNGKPTKLNERRWLQVRTPAFKNWFGDWENNPENASKVVDENGEPLVVYHGTPLQEQIDYFNTEKIGETNAVKDDAVGFYFSSSPDVASLYAEISKRESGQLIPVFLKIISPYKENFNSGFWHGKVKKNISLSNFIATNSQYDGVIIENVSDGSFEVANVFIALNPTQIKSAISNRGAFSTTESNILYSMGIREIAQQLWNDPTDIRPEIVNKPGLLQKWRADFIDFFAEMEKKSKDIYDTYSLLRSKKAARIEQARQEYFLPLRKQVTESPWNAQEVGDMAAARHIKVDNVNTRLAQRASYGYTKELLKALSTARRKELMQARVNVKAGKMPDGSVYLDANGNPVQMSARTKQQLMFDLMNKYSQYEITGADGIQVLREEWELFKDAAAGFSDGGVGSTKVRTVDDVLKLADKDRAKFDQIMTLFDAANRHTLELLEDGGLITAAEHARLLLDKSAYAPLRRESYKVDEEIARLFQRAGQGGSKQIATRSGTENLSEPTLVLQNALAAVEAAAAAAERNLANKELYKVIVKDRAGWKPWFTIVEKDKYITHDEDGFLQEKNATASNRADITLINDGKKLVIRPNMHNERAVGFVRAVNNLDAQVINGPMKVLSWLNQIVRWVNVNASPIFLMTNAFKDPFTAFYNIKATEAEKYTKEIFSPKTYKDSFRALKKVFMDGNRDPADPDVQWVEKWELAGGRTSFIETLRDMDETWKSFDKQVSRRKGTVFGINAPGFKSLMQAKDKWIDGLENFNILFENVMRFSTFKVLMQHNAVSEARAARISQDLTTNFTRRGYKTQALGTWWLFFNATVQGNYQVLRNLMSSKKVQAAVGGTVVMALLLDLLGRAVDDDWDKISERDKEKFIFFPLKVKGDFVRIPAPWVYNVVWRTGGLLGEMLSGVKTPQDGLLDIAAMTMTTFNPLGKPGSLAQAISPTGFDPFMQIIENKNFTGNPIGPEGFPGASKKANSELMWSNTPKGYQSFARFVNEATGGSAVESGAIDLKPGDYQVLVNFLTGSLGRFMSDATFGVKEALDKDFEGMRDIPVVKEFFSDPYDPLKSQKYHTNIAGIYGAHKLEQLYIKGPDRDLIKLQEVRENRGKELRMYSQAQDVERQIKSLRVRLRAAQNREDTAREKELRDRIGKLQERFNNVYQQRIQ